MLGQFCGNLRTSDPVTPAPVQYVAEQTRQVVSTETAYATHHVRFSYTIPTDNRPATDSAQPTHEAGAACPNGVGGAVPGVSRSGQKGIPCTFRVGAQQVKRCELLQVPDPADPGGDGRLSRAKRRLRCGR